MIKQKKTDQDEKYLQFQHFWISKGTLSSLYEINMYMTNPSIVDNLRVYEKTFFRAVVTEMISQFKTPTSTRISITLTLRAAYHSGADPISRQPCSNFD